MQSLIFAINAVSPIIIMVAIGYFLKKTGFLNTSIAKAINKPVFHFFLPVMLFLNVYKIEDVGDLRFDYILYVVTVVLVIFLASIPLVILVTRKYERRGALLQAAFRSNYALIGIPLAQSLFGDEGTMVATLLSAFIVPLLNILAVISLSLFSSEKPSVKRIFSDIIHNPLIRGVVAGLLVLCIRYLFVRYEISFRLSDITPIYKVLEYLSSLATPLALLCLGAQFEFSAVKELRREILFGTLMRTVVAPIIGIGTSYLLFADRFGGAQFASFVAAFATPVSISSVPMTQEMKGDVTLAGQLVVWTTLVSAFSVFLASFLLRYVGIF